MHAVECVARSQKVEHSSTLLLQTSISRTPMKSRLSPWFDGRCYGTPKFKAVPVDSPFGFKMPRGTVRRAFKTEKNKIAY